MEELSHKPCPHPDCSSTDAFSYNPNKGVGYCHSCSMPYPQKGVTYDEGFLSEYPTPNHQELEGIGYMPKTNVVSMSTAKVYRADRGITEDTMKTYGVETSVNSEGVSLDQIYPYPNGGRKIRTLPKTFKADRGFKADELFGMDKFNAGCAKACTVTCSSS